jgi:vancomycin resistance protein YoaR
VPETRRPRRRLVFAASFAVGLAAVLVASGGGLAAWDAGYDGRVLPGVHVGTVDVSGLDRPAATRVLATAFAYDQGSLILRTPDDGDITIPYAAFGRGPDLDTMVDEALRAGRDGGLVERAVGEVRQALDGMTIQPRLVLDQTALTTAIATALRPLERVPVNATIAMMADGQIVTTPAVPGRSVDPAPAVAIALDAMRSMEAPDEVVVLVTVAAVPPVRNDEDVAIATVRAQRLTRDLVLVWGKKTWTVKAATVRTWFHLEPRADGSAVPVIETAVIPAALDGVAKTVKKGAVSASFLKSRSGKVFGVVPGKDGRALDVDAMLARITAELEGRANGDLAAPVSVVTVKVPPKLTTEEAAASAQLMTKLGTWTTRFPISERNFFGANIWRPAQIINGTVLKPGQRFEWWSAIGPVTAGRGFGPGGVIRGTYTDPTGATGGGMCSSSTTLFNAALRAGLQINARSNHKYYINRYPLGLDATVSKMGGGTQTMSFTNDTKHPILIRGIRTRNGGRGYVTYEIWGIGDGRKVSIGRPAVANVRKAITTVVTVDTLRHGVREQVEYPSNAMDVSVTRVVRSAAGAVMHREVFYTHYVLWNGRIEVGR